MRTTISIDDALMAQALELAGPGVSEQDVLREALRTFVRVQSGRRLAALGGCAVDMPDALRRHVYAGDD